MSDNSRRQGIMASFSKVVFKKDGAEVFTATVTSGGCFGPDADIKVINAGYAELKRAIDSGQATAAANDFNSVAVRRQEYKVLAKGPAGIKADDLKKI